ncbi:MAG: molybdopterin molybdotransferase MoeA [Gemmatimonadetes bacterium]|nr:molybdopterin molybdotransferase MoeA [Gemmatimonadota bacterium]
MNRPTREADWLSVAEAIEQILGSVAPLAAEEIDLHNASGRTLAADVTAPGDHPPWDNSAMDGYAVRSADVRGARSDAPRTLALTESVAAGAFPAHAVSSGEAIRIMTGAPIPAGADGVIRLEHVRPLGNHRIEVLTDADAGRNIRPRGEDIRAGETVLHRGTLLRAGEIGVLATMGRSRVPVSHKPEVALLSTGNELVDLDGFEHVAAGRRIVNSNTWALDAASRAVGASPRSLGIARDDVRDIRAHLGHALGADAVVTTAGASVGEHDLVKTALDEMGARTLFWRVRIRPGSPFSFALLPRPGRPALPVFGLPGNPVSAVVTFEILVKPALRRMQGRSRVYASTLPVRVASPIESKSGLVRFLRVRLERRVDGDWWAEPTGLQGSGILTSVAQADALLVVPIDIDDIEAGRRMTAVPLNDGDAAQDRPGF